MLLDECVDRPSATRIFGEHEVRHVGPAGLSGLKDGKLLVAAAEAGYDLLFTTDQKLRHQQDVTRLPLRVLVLEARDTTERGLSRLEPALRRAIGTLEPAWRLGTVDNVGRFRVLVEEPPAGSP